MVDWNKPIQTRDGRKARVLALDVKGPYLVAVAIDMGDHEIVNRVAKSGSCYINDTRAVLVVPYDTEHTQDIINIPEMPQSFDLWCSRNGWFVGDKMSDAIGAYAEYRVDFALKARG